jgi:adenylate kinase
VRSILIGPPGAGKGTQLTSWPASSRTRTSPLDSSFAKVSALGQNSAWRPNTLDAGDLVPSDLTNALVADRLSQPDCRRHGFIRDGYPRSLEHAEAVSRTLAARDTSIDAVLKF